MKISRFDKLDFIRIKIFCAKTYSIKKMKRQSTELEKVLFKGGKEKKIKLWFEAGLLGHIPNVY